MGHVTQEFLERLGAPEIGRQDRRGEADLMIRSLRAAVAHPGTAHRNWINTGLDLARRQRAVAYDPPAPGRVRQMRIRLDKTGNFRLHRLPK